MTAESFVQAQKYMTVTTKQQARKKRLDFLDSMKVYENLCNDELPTATHIMSGRWVDTNENTNGVEVQVHSEKLPGTSVTRAVSQPQQQSKAFVCFWQGVSTDAIRDTTLLWQITRKLLSPGKSATVNKCTRNLTGEYRNCCWTDDVWYGRCAKAMLGLRTSPRRWQEHLSIKLKEHGYRQDERDPCLYMNENLDVCIGVHVDGFLTDSRSEVSIARRIFSESNRLDQEKHCCNSGTRCNASTLDLCQMQNLRATEERAAAYHNPQITASEVKLMRTPK